MIEVKMSEAAKAQSTIAEHIENKIRALIDAGVTIWGVNISELLEAQRKAIAKAQAERDKAHAHVKELMAYIERSRKPETEPVNTCEGCGEQCDQGEEGEGSEMNVEIKVTSNGPIPPGLHAMLNDLTSMLQSVARKK